MGLSRRHVDGHQLAELGHDPQRGARQRADHPHGAAELLGERPHQQLDRARELTGAAVVDGRRAVDGDVGPVVEQGEGELDPADAVGERVVDLLDERGPAVGQALHDGELPQRALTVEGGHGDGLRDRQHRREVARLRGLDPAQVVREVELGVGDPAGRAEAEGGRDDPLAEAGHVDDGLLQAGHESLPVGGLVEEADGGDRRAEHRVVLDAPQHGVGRLHRLAQPHQRRRGRRGVRDRPWGRSAWRSSSPVGCRGPADVDRNAHGLERKGPTLVLR